MSELHNNACLGTQAGSSSSGPDTAPAPARSEMARLIETFEWSRSPLGPSVQWPQSLKTILNVALRSRFQLAIYWGPELVFLYNDAEREVIGSMHPQALGKPAREVLVDMWDTVGPMLQRVRESGEATWSVDQPLMIDRYGMVEEAFFTWSYSPILDDQGGIGGVLLVTEETTQRVLAERRLRTLTEMTAEAVGDHSAEQAGAAAIRILGQNSADIPLAFLYLLDTGSVTFCSSTSASLRPRPEQFPLHEAIHRREAIVVDDFPGFFESGTADGLPKLGIVLPILESDLENVAGFLVAGISDHRRLDTAYRDFFDLVSARIGTMIASARAREQERTRLNAIAELDRAKTVFFTNISHEFRTPLTLILGVVERILAEAKRELDVSEREELSIVRRNAMRLQKLVNTVLAFAGVESERIRVRYYPTDLAIFTRELAGGFRSIMENAGLRFDVELQDLSELVYVDREMWEKIVLNLLSNAFKFTFEGGVSLTLQRDGNCAQMTVKDTGIGIQQHEMSRIFERFHRVEGVRGRTQEGTGIGLALVQELVKLHGGSIRAESVPDEGTSFIVSIPFGVKHLPSDCVRSDPTQSAMRSATDAYVEEARRWIFRDDEFAVEALQYPSSLAADRPFVLIADDNADMRDYLRSLLDGRYTVEAVGDGERALASIHRRKPSLVLADVMMPKLDGFSLLRLLRADPETQSIPVILISARAGEEERIAGMEHGADDYLVKPFNFRELLARVQSHIELARLRTETAERERQLRSEADSQRALLLTVLQQMPAGLVIARAPSGEVLLANNQAEQILRRPVQELRKVEEYSQYQLFHLDGSPYSTANQPLARSILKGEVVIGEELRYQCPDGTSRILLANCAPVRDETGTIVAGVAAFEDISELRLAQEELLRERNNVIHELAGRLISSQEEERRRIGRELHDDISQKLAFLQVRFEMAGNSPNGSRAGRKQQFEELRLQCEELVDDVQALSRRLHDSKLEYIGLVASVRCLCKELSKQHDINVEFVTADLPLDVPYNVSLCLFRVTQEALHNSLKYSGAKELSVKLGASRNEIRLEVRDAGVGFDVENALRNRGLGLLSMQERVNFLHGQLHVESSPGQGTKVLVSLPLVEAEDDIAAADRGAA